MRACCLELCTKCCKEMNLWRWGTPPSKPRSGCRAPAACSASTGQSAFSKQTREIKNRKKQGGCANQGPLTVMSRMPASLRSTRPSVPLASSHVSSTGPLTAGRAATAATSAATVSATFVGSLMPLQHNRTKR